MKLTDRGAERCVNGAELDVHEDRNTQPQSPVFMRAPGILQGRRKQVLLQPETR